MSTKGSKLSSVPKAPHGRARPDARDPTPVWKVVSELSSLHSQIAITETLITHLEANYIGSGEVEADDFIIRNDFARVPPPHLDEYLELLYNMRNEFEARLQGLNQLTVGPPPEEVEAEEEEEVVELEEFPVEESLENDEELEEDTEEDSEEAEEEEPEDDEDDEDWEEDDEEEESEEEEVDDEEDSEVPAPVPARGGHKRGNASDRRGSSRVSAVAH